MRNEIAAAALAVLCASAACGKDSFPPCDPGTVNCPCLDDGTCRSPSLVCSNSTCQACQGDACPPADPRCYTPCTGPVTGDDGNVRACSSEGLMDGCLSGSVCRLGSCITIKGLTAAPDARQGTCQVESDCTDYQTCRSGHCFSDCAAASDCASGSSCVRHVCRTDCTDTAGCPTGLACSGGACLPVLGGPAAQPTAPGQLVVTPPAMYFSTGATAGFITVQNGPDRARVIVVRKLEERTVDVDGIDHVLSADKGETPLAWLQMGVGQPAPGDRLTFQLTAGASAHLSFGGAHNPSLTRWTGVIEVSAADVAPVRVPVSFSQEVKGRWTGTLHAFGNFDDGSRPGSAASPLDTWMQERNNVGAVDAIPNAFLQAWARFRNGTLSIAEMQALVQSTLTGSWSQDRVRQLCRAAGYAAGAACAPFGGSGSQDVLLYTSSTLQNPIPSGVSQLDFAVSLRPATGDEASADPDCHGSASCFVGRIETSEALAFDATPAFHLVFEADPLSCQKVGTAGCETFAASGGGAVHIGGRYTEPEGQSGCTLSPGMTEVEFPWLVPGFTPPGVRPGAPGQQRTRVECRDGAVPFSDAARSEAFAAANPVPDGRPRTRTLEVIDGALFEQSRIFLLVRETTDSFHGGSEPLRSYGYVELQRQDLDLKPEDFTGQDAPDARPTPPSSLAVSCDPDLIRTVTGDPRARTVEDLGRGDLRNLARAVIRGDTSGVGDAPPPSVEADGAERVHYLCIFREEARLTDPSAGADAFVTRQVIDAGRDGSFACPAGAEVVFFSLSSPVYGVAFDPAADACNSRPESCLATVQSWMSRTGGVRLPPQGTTWFDVPAGTPTDLVYQCPGDDLATCKDDRFDLRDGKTFLSASQERIFFHPIETDIREAFRYRTEFASRDGVSVGFAPTICNGTDLVPYCYDPGLIEAVARRAECALAIYQLNLASPRFDSTQPDDAITLDTLRLFLQKSFGSVTTFDVLGNPRVEFGFERLHAELQIMLGDDAYTASFASRFDVAGSQALTFDGDRFEPNGVQLSGGAGFEMYQLYRAVQQYQLVLDRFYVMVPSLWASLEQPLPVQYLGETTVTDYLDHVIRASTQTAAAWSAIARHYAAIDRPDLARAVLERAYARTHQEAAILNGMMTEMTLAVSPSGIDQVKTELENAQRSYSVALLDMREAYEGITGQLNFFGLAPDFVPFPALGPSDVNAVETLLARTAEKLDSGAVMEARALSQSRAYEVNQASFQSELVTIRQTYQKQLGDLCGTFQGLDSRIYPAIQRYAYLSAATAGKADPCGETGNGQIWVELGNVQSADLQLQRARRALADSAAQAEDAEGSVAVQCGLIAGDVSAFLASQQAVDDMQGSIDKTQSHIGLADRIMADAGQLLNAETSALSGGFGAAAALTVASTLAPISAIHIIATVELQQQIDQQQREIRDRERKYQAWTIGRQCDYLTAQLGFQLRDLQRQMDLGGLDVIQATWNLQTEIGNLRGLVNQRLRLENEWDDSEQLAINASAAQTDPNVRIYKNDAILNADRSFQDALSQAYQATRVFEYYTAQTYARKDELFLVRLIDSGDPSLRSYMAELKDAYFSFQQQFGNPDTRVDVISMRDDVLKVPRYATDGSNRVLTAKERIDLFRRRLADPAQRDETGAVSFSFPTTFDRVPRLTANHKILLAEVELFGDTGDDVGVVYLRANGTGVVRDTDGNRIYYTLPARTAVMNPFFNGKRAFLQLLPGANSEIYRSQRFRDRPYAQTSWQLVLDQVNEPENQDINLAGLDDIVLHLYYTDFTP